MNNKTRTIECFSFKGVKVNSVNIERAINQIIKALYYGRPNYVCVNDVGNIVNSYRKNERLRNAINESYLSLPDGRPLSIYGKLIGYEDIGRVSGAVIMKYLFGENLSHCFIGDTEELHNRLAENVRNNFQNAFIKGGYSPPFKEWSEKDNEEIIKKINEFAADIVWISFGGGKQEVWMHENYKKIKRGVLIGIGAGFRWYLGDIKQAPTFLQKLSLEWLFRLVQQPSMFKRYASTLPFFVWDAFWELVKIKVFKINSEVRI
jgi:N-acetylglucosaminyldiphosphoundecaprenol N-acetyl-beta-D-mannosaminyltransferase